MGRVSVAIARLPDAPFRSLVSACMVGAAGRARGCERPVRGAYYGLQKLYLNLLARWSQEVISHTSIFSVLFLRQVVNKTLALVP
jgi:hypothetical protein